MKYREVEKKVELASRDYSSQARRLARLYAPIILPTSTLTCETEDLYWHSPNLQSIRLRDSMGEWGSGAAHRKRELTVKRQDRGDNVDRFEVNCNVSSIANARELVTAIVGGPPSLTIHKEELVLWAANDVVISLYRVNWGRCFLEVEAPEVGLVDKCLEALLPEFEGARVEARSLFEIYSEAVK